MVNVFFCMVGRLFLALFFDLHRQLVESRLHEQACGGGFTREMGSCFIFSNFL